MTYSIAVVDDDVDQARLAADLVTSSSLSRFFSEPLVISPAEVSAADMNYGHLDVVLMDIEFGEDVPNGIELVRQLFPTGCGTQVIYVTGHIEYCTRVYSTEHVWFLVKPFSQADLDQALKQTVSNLKASTTRPISVSVRGTTTLVQPRQISYVESKRRKLFIHAGDQVLETYGVLEQLAQELPDSFVQCHKSFLANLSFVESYSADGLVLRSGETVPVSQKRRPEVRRAVLDFFRE